MTGLSPIQKLLARHPCRNLDEQRQALRQIVQEIALLGLSRTDFFVRAAFYGGTALRIFYGLERFSEDLDFSLAEPDPAFRLDDYLDAVAAELGSWGFVMQVETKQKNAGSPIQSAFIKGGTLVHLVQIASVVPPVSGVPENELLKIKLEIDTDPPAGAGFEIGYRLEPIPFSVRLYDRPSLFAGKVHALLCRNWGQRVKGRDFFDFLWYLSNRTPVNAAHLAARLQQTGHRHEQAALTRSALLELLEERFRSVDFAQARQDVVPFLADTRSLDLWSADFFIAVARQHLAVQS